MARKGEEDPRWIVKERDDGKNVNAWHWEERDVSATAHEALKKAFQAADIPVDKNSELESAKTIEATEVEGDVTVAQRKGRIMCYFEIKLVVKWEARVREGDKITTVAGRFTSPEIEHDSFRKDFQVDVFASESGPAVAVAEKWAQNAGRAFVRSIVKDYFEKLFEEYKVGSKSEGAASLPPVADVASASPAPKSNPAQVAAAANKDNDAKASFSWSMRWRCPAEELFYCFTDERRVSGYLRGPCKIDPKPAGVFEFLGGAITGYFVNLEHPTAIDMQWRLSGWPSGHHASVAMRFIVEEPATTKMDFAMNGIPAGETERVMDGWRNNFFNPIKGLFGFTFDWL